MKKMLSAATACLFLLFSTNVSAQFSKGSKFVEANFGNIGFNKSDSKGESGGSSSKSDNKGFSINLFPRVGYFITDNFAVGAEVDIYFYNNKGNFYNSAGVKSSDSKTTEVSLGVGPFVRYYFAGDNRSRFYGQVGGSIYGDLVYDVESRSYSGGNLFSTTKYDYKKKYNNLAGNVLVGWNRILAENVALNMSLGYRYSHTTYTYNYTTTPVIGSPATGPDYKYTNSNNSVTWNIGFTMFFPSKAGKAKKGKK